MVIILALYFVLSWVPLFLSHSFALSYSVYNYGIIQLLIFVLLFNIKEGKRNLFLLSPSFIAVSYININFFFGSIVFENDLVFDFVLNPYHKWENYNVVMGYFNLANFMIITSFFVSKKIKNPLKLKLLNDFRSYSTFKLSVLGIIIIGFFSVFDLKLDFFGGDGTFSMVPKTLGALILIVSISKTPELIKRVIFYLIIIGFFSTISWESKRDAIFLLLPILLLESQKFKLKFSFKKVFVLLASVVLLLQLILAMSIFRGYGDYQPKNFIDANTYVLDYIKSDEFIPSFMNNMEISYTFFHSNNAIETIIKEPERLTYGKTLIKPFFIFIPRQIISAKPKSIIHNYTVSVSESYRKKGGSWPVSAQSEMFWNFHFLGVFAAGFLFVVINSLYLNIHSLIENGDIINYIPLLYLYQTLLVLFRGSGLDMFLIFVIMAMIIFIPIKFIARILLPKRI